MTRHKMIVLCFGFTLVPSIAFAENVSQADQDACTPDVFKLCQEFIPDEAPIVSCLQSKKSQLSPACLRVIFPPTAPTAKNKTMVVSRPAHHAKRKHKKPHS